MRAAMTILGGMLIGAAISAAFLKFSTVNPVDPRAGGPDAAAPRGENLAAAHLAEKVEALNARIAELEEALRAARENSRAAAAEENSPAAQPAAADPAAAVDAAALAALLEGKDWVALAAEFEKLLLLGEAGHATLLEFLQGVATPPRNALLRDGRLPYALAILAEKHPEAMAEFARYLLDSPAGEAPPQLRAQLFGLLPAFLAFHGDRFPELQEEFKRELLADVDQTRGNLWQTFKVMGELGVEAPLESLQNVLSDPGKANYHGLAVQQLAKRNDLDSLETLARIVDSAQNLGHPIAQQALRGIAQMDLAQARAVIDQYLASPVREVREAALFAYFSTPRDLGSLGLAVDYLNSQADSGQKMRLIYDLQRSSAGILQAIRQDPAMIADAKILEMAQKDPVMVRQFFATDAGGISFTDGAVQVPARMVTAGGDVVREGVTIQKNSAGGLDVKVEIPAPAGKE